MISLLRCLRPAGLLLLLLVASWALPTSALARTAKTNKNKVTKQSKAKQRGKTSRRSTRGTNSRKATTTLRLGKKGAAPWQKLRTQTVKDTGIKDHASRHSELSTTAYLALGQKNVSHGRMLKGGGRHSKARYHIRKLSKGGFSMTITNKKGSILSIDTWKSQGTPLTKATIERGLRASGVTPPKGFWKKL